MLCPFCNHIETKVVDSRDTQENKAIRRRRECESCEKRFSTYETYEGFQTLIVKKNGVKEPYDRTKIERGLRRAFEKRPGAETSIENILGELENYIQNQQKHEMTSRELGDTVLRLIKEEDPVAYVRFASVYKSFGSLERFRKFLEQV
ncbi:MAG: transcriptional regulator NrdR [Candidatus Moranbacteria bacterium]|nr:transcriptional regulator NrdR [Candidatus Moranbacteria bacterium]